MRPHENSAALRAGQPAHGCDTAARPRPTETAHGFGVWLNDASGICTKQVCTNSMQDRVHARTVLSYSHAPLVRHERVVLKFSNAECRSQRSTNR